MILDFITKPTILTFLWCLIFSMMMAQDPVMLSLTEAVEKTMANNHQIKIADFEHLAAHSDIEQMKSLYLPQVEATVNSTVNNLPLQAFGSRLQQGAIVTSDFAPEALNNPSSIFNLQSQLIVRQPILNLDGRAKKDALIAKKNALQQQSINVQKTLRHQVVQTYLQLQLNYEMIKVLQVAKSTATANLKLTKDNLAVGYVKMVDVLAVELMISKLDHQLLETNQNIQNTSDQLSFLMGDSFDNLYQPIDTLSELNQSSVLMEEAPTDRSDLLAAQHKINAQQHQLTALQKADAIRLNAFGSYELNNSLDFEETQHGYLIGMQASWRIFNGNKDKSAVQKAQIELEKYQTILSQLTERNKLELEIAKRKMTQAQSKISLTKKAIAQAEEVLRIKSNRYAEGLELTTEVLNAATKVSQMQMDYKKAVYQYRKNHEQILFFLEKD